jgi:conjugative transfer signal peptidase TraF
MNRRNLLIIGGLAVAGLLVPAAIRTPPGLVWNASASAPIGLYAVRPMHRPVRGVLAVITPPASLAQFAAERHYLPLGVPLIKPVEATGGHTVCRSDLTITIDQRAVGRALARDGHGRPLPVWQGCRTLGPGEIFVMNATVRDSFDGRYFGPLPTSAVLGRARPLWTDPSPHPSPRS